MKSSSVKSSAVKSSTVKRVAGIVLAAGVMAGCASNSQLEEIRVLAEESKMASEAAAVSAANAERMAEMAMQNSAETDEKIDRMFKKSMLK